MKRLISGILILIVFVTSFTVSFANKSPEKVLLEENGKGENYQVVNLEIDGKIIKSEDVPPIIYPLDGKGRTLIPLRMIIEYLGDKLNADIEWDGTRREAKIKTKEKEIVLQIDNPYATVNGVKKRLPDDISAKLLAIRDNGESIGRTMIPIRFFEEEFEIGIEWDQETSTASLSTPKRTERNPEERAESNPGTDISGEDVNVVDITDIRFRMNGSAPQVRIKTSGKTDYNEFKLTDPERLVFDFDNAKFSLRNRNRLGENGILDIETESEAIKKVRVSQFKAPTRAEPDESFVTRVVIELGNLIDYEMTFDNETGEFIIDFANYIYDVKKEIINVKEVIVIEGDMVDDYKITRLNDPERIVVDITGATLHNKLKNRTINVDGRVVKSIRASQYTAENKISDEKITRVVLDLHENIEHGEPYVEVKDNKLEVHVEGEPFKTILYEETGWTTSKFTLKGSRVTRYDVERRLIPNTIDITVPKADIDLESMNLDVDDHIIKTINIDENGENYNIKLELQDAVVHDILSSKQEKDLVLELNNKDAKYREILIIIDPGHGGSDPGAISPILNMKESEIVLDISLRLNKLLTEEGFRTYMTRVDNLNKDFKLDLQDRVDAANALQADLFISVHANSFMSNSISGIETFYSPKDMDGKKLAQVIQSTLIDDLKMVDRGAKPTSYFVLEHTIMPAALIETGFLSNSSDEAKLATNSYREQVAESTYKAIIEYFETTR